MAAAAAVATGKKRKRPHIFESNPSIRKRQQTRLLRWALNNRKPSFPPIMYCPYFDNEYVWLFFYSKTKLLPFVAIVLYFVAFGLSQKVKAPVCLQKTESYSGWVHHQSGTAGHSAVYLSLQTQPSVQGVWCCSPGKCGKCYSLVVSRLNTFVCCVMKLPKLLHHAAALLPKLSKGS